MTISITDNLGNYAEATEEDAPESAGLAVTTLLKDDPNCTTIVVTRTRGLQDLQTELDEIMDEANERMWGS